MHLSGRLPKLEPGVIQPLDELAARYQFAPAPSQGQKATMWYRMSLLTLDWSENWSRLALYQTWRGERNEKLDGTNNVTEQIIGQSIKERYRPMGGINAKNPFAT